MKAIGGYLELECRAGAMLHADGVLLNSGQSALRYIIRANGIRELWVPRYTCPVVGRALEEEGCRPKYYGINAGLRPQCNFAEDDFVLLNNYFGVNGGFVERFFRTHERLIIDNAQSFYSAPLGCGVIYSPRKFFGVPDGGIAFSRNRLSEQFEQDHSWSRCSHLLKRRDGEISSGYADFRKNDEALAEESVKVMSNLTKALLDGIDYSAVRRIRIRNFNHLKKAFDSINELHWESNEDDVPLCYPLLLNGRELRSRLIERSVFVPCYWPVLSEPGEWEKTLEKYLLPLPVDQRYGIEDMKEIEQMIKEML